MMAPHKRHGRLSLVLAGVLVCGSAYGSTEATNYLGALTEAMGELRATVPAMTASAESAAKVFVADGNLWAAGPQEDFISEACGRAGGLMAIAPLGEHTPTNHDVILYSAPGKPDEHQAALLKEWRAKGALVIEFVSTQGLFRDHFPLDTTVNVARLWSWTGEFVAACTRLKKMPILYLSYGLPGGPERGKKYQGKKFHDDLTIEPLAGGRLGLAYLDQVTGMLEAVNKTQLAKLQKAAMWWREASENSSLAFVIGHMFPRHLGDSRAPRWCRFAVAPPWEDKHLLEGREGLQFVLYLGYQAAPQRLVERAAGQGIKLLYVAVQSASPTEPGENILYVNPAWPRTDACVQVAGYDIPILPASGVMQAAIYWTLASERKG